MSGFLQCVSEDLKRYVGKENITFCDFLKAYFGFHGELFRYTFWLRVNHYLNLKYPHSPRIIARFILHKLSLRGGGTN